MNEWQQIETAPKQNGSEMSHLHELIDAHAERAKQELHDMTQLAIDRIKVKAGWYIRSDAQKRRWHNARTCKNENT